MSTEHITSELTLMGAFGESLTMRPIFGGVLNHSFVLQGENARYFVKTFDSQHLSEQERRAQFRTQQALAEQDMAPRPLYLNKSATFQVDTWVEHVPLSESKLSDEEQVVYLAGCLHQIHQASAPARKLDLQADWRHYIDIARLKPDLTLLEQVARAERIWLETADQHQVLCHNDLSRAHCSVQPHNMLFDWEYAAIGNRFFDLAACIYVNRLNAQQGLLLQQHYARLSHIPLAEVVAACRDQYELVQVTNQLWYCAAGEATLPVS